MRYVFHKVVLWLMLIGCVVGSVVLSNYTIMIFLGMALFGFSLGGLINLEGVLWDDDE